MKPLFAAVCVTASLPAQIPQAFEETRMHLETSFDVVVHASYAETAALFGPEGECAWAGKHWDPQFIHPSPARDIEGAVFTVKHGPLSAVWVIATHDTDGRHFKYVYFIADLMVTTIDVRFTPIDTATTQVYVTYARTAMTPEGDEHVVAMNSADKNSGKEWQSGINSYFANRKPAANR
jgi:hypothetical protein